MGLLRFATDLMTWYNPIRTGRFDGSGAMDNVMTIAEIEDRYDGEWVLVEDPETDEAFEVLSGKVVYHSKDKSEFDRKAVELRPRSSVVLYFGKMPKNAAIALSL
jgi:hypothetical protein